MSRTQLVSAESSAVISKPVEDVFAFVSDQANESKWHTDVVEVRAASSTPIRLGSTLTWVVKFMGTNEYSLEVTGFEPHRRIELTTTEGPMKPTLTHRFEPAGGGTRYTRHVDIPLEGMLRIVGPVMRAGMAQKRNARFVQNLKGLLERQSRRRTQPHPPWAYTSHRTAVGTPQGGSVGCALRPLGRDAVA